MSVQKTDRVLKCYRIGDSDGAFPIYDSEGARLYPGRWNTHTSPIIYTSEHYSTALLEKLMHANLVMAANQHFIEITIPNGVSCEVFQIAAIRAGMPEPKPSARASRSRRTTSGAPPC
jgi:RES domain-containing protein